MRAAISTGGINETAARALASGRQVGRLALVVAHADDETLWAGAMLARTPEALLIHATDSAPRDMADAHRLGFADLAGYAEARARELDRALAVLGVAPDRRAYAIADQELAHRLGELVERLTDDLAGCELVATHPYEGGHPDHDSLALAVSLALARLARLGQAPAQVEFACYHERDGERCFGRFWPDPARPEHRRALGPAERRRLHAAIDAHATQARVVDGWQPAAERWRAAPAYDFAAPPPSGAALYDRFGWAMTSARWRALAVAAMEDERAWA